MKACQTFAFALLCTGLLLSACSESLDADEDVAGEIVPTSAPSTQPFPSSTKTLLSTPAPTPQTNQNLKPTSLIPFPVFVTPGVWLIDNPNHEIQIQFDTTRWESTQFDEFVPLYYEGGPVLVHTKIDDCQLSLNFGGGVPMDWNKATEETLLGDHDFSKTSFRDGNGKLQFVIYDQLFRVTFGNDIESCIYEIEVVLESYLLP